ncbi:hypothetical protein ANO14919_001750 [Xylariales sp. No.14919]|nr:hypothetical protein ANO14919_001750 [Xylariales sp. No.14919]
MGLLNFLSKKSYSDLKTSAYDTTVASSPPIRGTYPVLGNGSKILEEFQKSHPNLATISHNNTPASSPLVSRFRGDGLHGPGVERPRTAPSSQPGEIKNSLGLPPEPEPEPSLPPIPKKKYGPYRLPPKVSTDIRASTIPAQPVPSPSLVSIYSDSARSSEPGKPRGYVDLLDAQSMIRPSNFHSRIQATGARNYGEDVADRNREEKENNPDTTKTQEAPSNRGGELTSVITKDIDNDSDDEPLRPLRIRHSVSSNLRPKMTSPHTSDSFPKRTSSRLPRHDADETPKVMSRTASARSERAARRQSTPSFLASAPGELPRSSSAGKRGKEEDPGLLPDSLKGHSRSSAVHEREYPKPNISTKRQSLASSYVEHQSRPKRTDLDKPLPALPTSSKNHSRRKTISHNNAVVESRLLAKRQSLHGMRSASRGEFYEDTYQQKLSLQSAQLPRDRNSARRQLGSTTDLQDSFYNSPAQQSDHNSQIISVAKYSDNKGESSQSNHLRKSSFISLSNQSILAREAGTPIPERSSSLRHYRHTSLTSETALSTLSSNPFRPQSGHTTSTSIDFSPMFPRAYLNESVPPVPDMPLLKPLQSMPEDAAAMPSPIRSPSIAPRHESDEFYLEDYASSDDETSPSSSRGSYEKDLLFSDTGYGVSGNQLSGLPGLFDMTVSASSAGLSTSQAWDNDSHNVPRMFHMPAYLQSDSNDYYDYRDSSDEEMNFDIPMSRAGSALRYTQVLEQFPARQPAEEEDDDSDH